MASNQALRTSKNALMLVVGNLCRMVATFGFVLYSAAILGVEGFGKYQLSLNLFELFLGLAATAVGILLTRDVARWPKQLSTLLTSAIALTLCLAFIAPLAMLLLGNVFGYAQDTIQALAIASLGIFPAVICVLFEAIFVAKERAEFVTLGTAIESLIRIFLGVAALHFGYGFLTLMWIVTLSRTSQLLLYWLMIRRVVDFRWTYRFDHTWRFASRWRVFAAENWMAAIYMNLDVLMLSWIAGEAAVGLYSAAGKFVRLGSIFSRSFTTAVFPVMSRMFSESPDAFHRFYQHSIRVMYTVAFPIVIGVTVLAERIVALMYTDEYQGTVPVLRVLIWLVLIDFLNPFLSHVLFAQGRQHRSMHVAAISLCVNSLVCFMLVKSFGALGAAMGSVFGGLVAMCCYMFFAIPRSDVLATFTLAFRALLAAVGMGAAVFLLRDAYLVAIVAASGVVYVALLFLIQAIRSEDITYFRTVLRSRAAT